MNRVAVYTTFFPAIARFIPEWHRSLRKQTLTDFTLWVGLDGFPVARAQDACGSGTGVRWVPAHSGDSPAALRARAIAAMLEEEPAGIVFVDADDVLDPTRVASAAESLSQADVSGCAAELLDEESRELGIRFPPPDCLPDPERALPRWNCFGLSTSAYGYGLLKRLPEIPAGCIAADWWLATHAWLAGARFHFDPVPRMGYRQHGANLAGVLPPFTPARLLRSAEIVVAHHLAIAGTIPTGCDPAKRQALREAAAQAAQFLDRARGDQRFLERYAGVINSLPGPHPWWAWVGHPEVLLHA